MRADKLETELSRITGLSANVCMHNCNSYESSEVNYLQVGWILIYLPSVLFHNSLHLSVYFSEIPIYQNSTFGSYIVML